MTDTSELYVALAGAQGPLPGPLRAKVLDYAAADRTAAEKAVTNPTFTAAERAALVARHPQAVAIAWLTEGSPSVDDARAAATDRRIGVREAVATLPDLPAEVYRATFTDRPHARIALALGANPSAPAPVAYDALVAAVTADPESAGALLAGDDAAALTALMGRPDAHDTLARFVLDTAEEFGAADVQVAPWNAPARLVGDLPGLSFELWSELVRRTGGHGPSAFALARLAEHPHAETPAGERLLEAQIATLDDEQVRRRVAGRLYHSLRREWAGPERRAARRPEVVTARPIAELVTAVRRASRDTLPTLAGELLSHPELAVEHVVELAAAVKGHTVWPGDLVTFARLTAATDEVAAALCALLRPEDASRRASTAADPAAFASEVVRLAVAHTSFGIAHRWMTDLIAAHGGIEQLPVGAVAGDELAGVLVDTLLARGVCDVAVWDLLATLHADGSRLTVADAVATASSLAA